MSLKEALQEVEKYFSAYHDRKIGTSTAHNAECTSVSIELEADMSGCVVVEGSRTDVPDSTLGRVVSAVFTEGTTNKIPFDNIEELVDILK